MSERSIEAKQRAGNYFREGYNCAEAVFLTFRECFGKNIDEDLVRLFTGFGLGVGKSGCMCGALSASVAVLGMLTGRTTNDQEMLDERYRISKEFHDRFKNKFGSVCCRILGKADYGTKEQLRNCLKITGNTSELLMEYIEENIIHSQE